MKVISDCSKPTGSITKMLQLVDELATAWMPTAGLRKKIVDRFTHESKARKQMAARIKVLEQISRRGVELERSLHFHRFIVQNAYSDLAMGNQEPALRLLQALLEPNQSPADDRGKEIVRLIEVAKKARSNPILPDEL